MAQLNDVLYFLVWAVVGFVAFELGAGLLHKYVFHGFLWRIHESHHRPVRGQLLEKNDLFAVLFAALPISLMMTSSSVHSAQFAVGAGITFHGALYFVIHDLMTHHRWFPMKPRSRWAQRLVQAHRIHHQKVTPEGQGPWGLFLVRLPEGSPKVS